MFNFLKKKTKENEKIDIISKTASLLIHAAKIDENYTNKEKLIIEKTLMELGVEKEKLAQIMINAEENEKNSNQILDFTKEVKNMNEDSKIKIVEVLWNIIYSDNNPDNLLIKLDSYISDFSSEYIIFHKDWIIFILKLSSVFLMSLVKSKI